VLVVAAGAAVVRLPVHPSSSVDDAAVRALLRGVRRVDCPSATSSVSALTYTHLASFPDAASASDRFRAALAATFLPGASTVPFADLVMLFRFRSSTTMTACYSTSCLAVCRAQFSVMCAASEWSRFTRLKRVRQARPYFLLPARCRWRSSISVRMASSRFSSSVAW
jgi:hypothetical protein